MSVDPVTREHVRRGLLIVTLVVAGLVALFAAGFEPSTGALTGVSVATSALVAAARPRPAGC